MRPGREGHHPTARLFAAYGAICVVPVIALGLVLSAAYRTDAQSRGIAEGRSEAVLIAKTAIGPHLDGLPLSRGLSSTEQDSLDRLVRGAVHDGDILRLRLRDLSGQVVFSDDGSGFNNRPEDEALDAANGRTVTRLTRLNSDSVDTGSPKEEAVEVYLPLAAGIPERRVGVLEIYLPYAPIQADVTAGLHQLYLDLGIGLALLYVAIFAIAWSVSRGFRRQLRVNKHLAESDPLTDLPNRTVFHRRAEAALRRQRLQRRSSVVVAIVDLDRFKEINDTLGHHNGDKLLSQIAERLGEVVRGHDTVARLGGDEFGIVLSDVSDSEEVLWRLRGVIEREVSVSGLPLSIDSSVGYAVAPEDGTNVDELLQRADVAMYVAKAQHAGVIRYDHNFDHYDAAKLALVSELRGAIERDELELHYQPKATVADGHVKAVEALVRWRHPREGLLGPDRFVPLAEQTDLIERLTEWVIARALRDLRSLDPLPGALAVAVNVSARNLSRPGIDELVTRELAESEIAPERLIVEITETALLADPARASEVLRTLTAMGVSVSIDDFGCGQTSLGYLSTLPIKELKIDRSFVGDMLHSSAHAAIVRSIVDLGHNLTLNVVAEGVESSDVLQSLRMIGCDLVQGFFLARPMPLADLQDWMLARAPEKTSVAAASSTPAP
jgi:diguanylate cyclase